MIEMNVEAVRPGKQRVKRQGLCNIVDIIGILSSGPSGRRLAFLMAPTFLLVTKGLERLNRFSFRKSSAGTSSGPIAIEENTLFFFVTRSLNGCCLSLSFLSYSCYLSICFGTCYPSFSSSLCCCFRDTLTLLEFTIAHRRNIRRPIINFFRYRGRPLHQPLEPIIKLLHVVVLSIMRNRLRGSFRQLKRATIMIITMIIIVVERLRGALGQFISSGLIIIVVIVERHRSGRSQNSRHHHRQRRKGDQEHRSAHDDCS
ncbi:hypothetical protein EX30DRAFT_243522 [Ascodesmis nigricans]|uniref:Uncharacterized protein n=1 Tax=Ascodesmis nigricans TaxID=341454 RepID=A0A4V3SHK7_9PEZI|nr:hypothetical protein EX30DRAFT_243522 [Ascodesmis nigricans]